MFNSKKELTSTEVSSMKIGSNIAALRKEKGITQEELANALGVSAQAVSKWENNSSCPDVSLLTVIADYFGVTVDALLRSGAEEITRADTPSTDNNVAAAHLIRLALLDTFSSRRRRMRLSTQQFLIAGLLSDNKKTAGMTAVDFCFTFYTQMSALFRGL